MLNIAHALSSLILETTLEVDKIIIPILEMKELKFREVNVLHMVTEPVSGKDVAIATDPHWLVCIYSIASKLVSTS